MADPGGSPAIATAATNAKARDKPGPLSLLFSFVCVGRFSALFYVGFSARRAQSSSAKPFGRLAPFFRPQLCRRAPEPATEGTIEVR
jgi:hypothetical protein